MFFPACRVIVVLAAVAVFPATTWATPVLVIQETSASQGTFINDNDVQYFQVALNAPGTLEVRTLSYNAGGFDPLLTLFSGWGPSAEMLESNDDDAACEISCLDAVISRSLDAGLYTIALTQTANSAFGTLGDGFLYANDPLYTTTLFPADPGATTGFWDASGTQRTGAWEVQIDGPDSMVVVPEPGSFVLMGIGAVALGGLRLRRGSITAGR
jgi:hypothetical protein